MASNAHSASSRTRRAGSARKVNDLGRVLTRLENETPLWQAFLAAHRKLVDQMADQMLRDHQLPLEWFDVLVHLATDASPTTRQKDLRDQVLLSESAVSRLLMRVEKAGLLTRSTADDDHRGIELAITDKGREALAAATVSHLDLVAALFTDRLTATDRAALNRILSKLVTESPRA
jgi:DNA-binding MarR family transcriptional regulator